MYYQIDIFAQSNKISISQNIEILDIFYIPEYLSNLIFLSKLKEMSISYYNDKNYIIFKKKD